MLVDEVNRATPKTQSALLEAMEENHVTVDGVTHPLPEPFFVLATQNPQHQIGTFPLPESQLDRFLMRIELGVPDRASERAMLLGSDRRTLLRRVGSSEEKPDAADLVELCEALLSGRGEASGTAMAREVLDRYHHLDQAGRVAFFRM